MERQPKKKATGLTETGEPMVGFRNPPYANYRQDPMGVPRGPSYWAKKDKKK